MFPTKRIVSSQKKNKETKSENSTLEDDSSNKRLLTINSDIEKLYKKYSEIRKKRLCKEKTQQILVNRIKYLKNEVNRSLSKKGKDLKNKSNNAKIQMKFEENYVNKKEQNKYKNKVIEKHNSIFSDNESISKISLNESESIGKSYGDIKLKNNNIKNNLIDKENNQNICNIMNGKNNVENIVRRNKYNIGNNNSNNNIYIIINNPKNYNNENSPINNLENIINNSINNNKPNNNNRQNRNNKNLHRKYKSGNNLINFNPNGGENVILMKADGVKLQDIINSINNMNINNKNKNVKINNKETSKKKTVSSERNLINKKINTRNINNNLLKNIEIKDEFVRPNFLNLYKNEDASIIKKPIDMNTFINKTESSLLQSTESFLTHNILNDIKREENKNILKQKNKKNSVIKDINNKNYNINESNNFLYNTYQSISCSSCETLIQKEKNRNNLREYKKSKDVDLDNINKLKDNNANNHQDKFNIIKQNLNNTNTNTNLNYMKLKNNKSEKIRPNHFRSDSYSNSIENKKRFLGLEFKPNIKRELSIQTEQNSEKKNKLLKKIKYYKKCNNILDREKLIKVKKSNVVIASKKKNRNKKAHNLIKNKTVTDFNRNKRNLNLTERNDENNNTNNKK